MIKVKYISVDSYGRGKWKTFKTLKGARKFAQYWVGKHPELGSTYAVSGDGVGKIVAEGVALKDLFGEDSASSITIEAIAPEAWGDWHDKPVRYAVHGPGSEVQKFSTKKDAQKYASIRRKAATQNDAIQIFARLP